MAAFGMAGPVPWHAMMRRTVVVVDMVGYRDIAKMLEENISAGSVSDLNSQIQAMIGRSLNDLKDPDAYCLMARTGDGAIVLFERAGDAHTFSFSVHLQAQRHNAMRSEVTAKRRFRIGIATGEVSKSSCEQSADEYAGIAIANAVRLESAAKACEIVIDSETFAELPPESQKFYGAEEIVKGKRKESFRARRCALPEALAAQASRARRFTRRQMICWMRGSCWCVCDCYLAPNILYRVCRKSPAKEEIRGSTALARGRRRDRRPSAACFAEHRKRAIQSGGGRS